MAGKRWKGPKILRPRPTFNRSKNRKKNKNKKSPSPSKTSLQKSSGGSTPSIPSKIDGPIQQSAANSAAQLVKPKSAASSAAQLVKQQSAANSDAQLVKPQSAASSAAQLLKPQSNVYLTPVTYFHPSDDSEDEEYDSRVKLSQDWNDYRKKDAVPTLRYGITQNNNEPITLRMSDESDSDGESSDDEDVPFIPRSHLYTNSISECEAGPSSQSVGQVASDWIDMSMNECEAGPSFRSVGPVASDWTDMSTKECEPEPSSTSVGPSPEDSSESMLTNVEPSKNSMRPNAGSSYSIKKTVKNVFERGTDAVKRNAFLNSIMSNKKQENKSVEEPETETAEKKNSENTSLKNMLKKKGNKKSVEEPETETTAETETAEKKKSENALLKNIMLKKKGDKKVVEEPETETAAETKTTKKMKSENALLKNIMLKKKGDKKVVKEPATETAAETDTTKKKKSENALLKNIMLKKKGDKKSIQEPETETAAETETAEKKSSQNTERFFQKIISKEKGDKKSVEETKTQTADKKNSQNPQRFLQKIKGKEKGENKFDEDTGTESKEEEEKDLDGIKVKKTKGGFIDKAKGMARGVIGINKVPKLKESNSSLDDSSLDYVSSESSLENENECVQNILPHTGSNTTMAGNSLSDDPGNELKSGDSSESFQIFTIHRDGLRPVADNFQELTFEEVGFIPPKMATAPRTRRTLKSPDNRVYRGTRTPTRFPKEFIINTPSYEIEVGRVDDDNLPVINLSEVVPERDPWGPQMTPQAVIDNLIHKPVGIEPKRIYPEVVETLPEIRYAFGERDNSDSVHANETLQLYKFNKMYAQDLRGATIPNNINMERLETSYQFMTPVYKFEPSEGQAEKAIEMRQKGYAPKLHLRHKVFPGSYDVYSVDVDYMRDNHINIPRFAWKNKPDKLQKKLDHTRSRKRINMTDEFGRSACHFAAAFGEAGIMKQLLNCEERCDVNAKDDDGKTPLHKAVEAWDQPGALATLSLLLQHGAKPTIPAHCGRNPLEYALQEIGDKALNIIKHLYIDAEMFKLRREPGRITHLHQVCMARKDVKVIETAKFLLQHGGAFVNATEGAGRTAVMLAAKKERPELVNLLIAYGAQVDHVDAKMHATLHYAPKRGASEKIIRDALNGIRPPIRHGLVEESPQNKKIKKEIAKLKF